MAGQPSSLPVTDQQTLLRIARKSIDHGLRTGQPMEPALTGLAPALLVVRATFVTLNLDTRLRGCIGMLRATRPLAIDVAHNAFAAAFRDPRFTAVTADEAPRLDIHISILSPPEPMEFLNEDGLLLQIRPGVDGLILEESRTGQRGTFLPAVWEQLPDRKQFLEHLKTKAGLSPGYWSPTIRVYRYGAESVP